MGRDSNLTILMKHKVLSNRYFDERLQGTQELQGWVRWPRTQAQKAGVEKASVTAPIYLVTIQEPPSEEKEISSVVEEVKRKRGRPPLKR